MTKTEKIESIREFINDTKEYMADTPANGMPGTAFIPHHILKHQIKQAEEQIKQLKA